MKFKGENMEENKELMINEEKEQLNKNKDRLKVVLVASIILFVLDVASLLFSLLTKDELNIQPREIGYFVVMAVCIVIFIISITFIRKTQKRILDLEDK